MRTRISSTEFGLSNRVILESDGNSIIIVKQRKSRIIMSDSKKITAIRDTIKTHKPNVAIKLLISGPICSKSTKFLNENDIEVIK
ncbi:MAG: hypothetical protein KAG84_06270 [Bacteroidales bacterium]|nr:hypothetical protein [Bacteroidales bacterium]